MEEPQLILLSGFGTVVLGSSCSCQVLILWSIPGNTPASGEGRSCASSGVACEIRQIRGEAALRF